MGQIKEMLKLEVYVDRISASAMLISLCSFTRVHPGQSPFKKRRTCHAVGGDILLELSTIEATRQCRYA